MSARAKYAIGTTLYAVAAYFGLKLMGAPMDAVNELLKTLAFMLGLTAGIFLLPLRTDRQVGQVKKRKQRIEPTVEWEVSVRYIKPRPLPELRLSPRKDHTEWVQEQGGDIAVYLTGVLTGEEGSPAFEVRDVEIRLRRAVKVDA
jgi:hypothetical protein